VLVVSLTQERTGRLKVETEAERVRLTAEGGGGRKSVDFHPKSGAALSREKSQYQKSKRKFNPGGNPTKVGASEKPAFLFQRKSK
jgi:hypothetical protein